MHQCRIRFHAIGKLPQQDHTLGDILDLLGAIGSAHQGRRILKVVRVDLVARGFSFLEDLEILFVRANEVLGHHGDLWQRQRRF